ncbi:hypothetical protein Bcep1808_1200 [Burkholderia vietnamiensis G4]|uniref:Uncharacterized protein n=1 Tax=Burkholderia vietnamiensis (strain G4 / LMG 22486) TaxID=269482 RepID=A4JD58_BURVG|nr:hypothetical protein Bcep1808_1200 [Burkholderia vietnamiensis G4]
MRAVASICARSAIECPLTNQVARTDTGYVTIFARAGVFSSTLGRSNPDKPAHAFTLHFARLDRDPALGAIRLVERVYATKMRCLQYKCSGRADRRVQQGSEAIDVIGGFRSVKRLS